MNSNSSLYSFSLSLPSCFKWVTSILYSVISTTCFCTSLNVWSSLLLRSFIWFSNPPACWVEEAVSLVREVVVFEREASSSSILDCLVLSWSLSLVYILSFSDKSNVCSSESLSYLSLMWFSASILYFNFFLRTNIWLSANAKLSLRPEASCSLSERVWVVF